MKNSLLILMLLVTLQSFSQVSYDGQEIGVEGYAGGSNLGGAFGFELKHASILNKYIVVGPSFRYQRVWSNNYNVKTNINVWGGGVFAHYRIQNKLFVGTEFQMLRSPYNFVSYASNTKKWAASLMLGGGFYLKLGEKVRLNAALFYDVINAENSPFRTSYFFKVKNQAGQIVRTLPIIYRVTFFIPIGSTK